MKTIYKNSIISLEKQIKKRNLKEKRLNLAGAIIGDGKTEMTEGTVGLVIFDELKNIGLDEIRRTPKCFDLDKFLCSIKQFPINLKLTRTGYSQYLKTIDQMDFYEINMKDENYFFQRSLFEKLLKCFDLKQTRFFKGENCIILEEIENEPKNNKQIKILKRGIVMRYKITLDNRR